LSTDPALADYLHLEIVPEEKRQESALVHPAEVGSFGYLQGLVGSPDHGPNGGRSDAPARGYRGKRPTDRPPPDPGGGCGRRGMKVRWA
jgi:hypothetical protein